MTTPLKPRKGVAVSDASRCTATNKKNGERCSRCVVIDGKCSLHMPRKSKKPPAEIAHQKAPDTLEGLRAYLAQTLLRALAAERYGDAAKLAVVQVDVINLLDGDMGDDFDGMDAESIRAAIESVEKRLGN